MAVTTAGDRTAHVGPRVRLYHSVRTAHLERAHALAPATIVYGGRRTDFDERAAEGLDLVRAGAWRAAWLLLTSDVRELEVNEPWMVPAARRTALALAGLRLGDVRRRRRTTVVTYAIENDDRLVRPRATGPRRRLAEALDRSLVRLNARRVDRIAFGTDGARELYRRTLPSIERRARSALVPALPTACDCPDLSAGTGAGTADQTTGTSTDRSGGVLFLGALHPRKGADRLLEAWPAVAERRPGARLTVVGDGPLLPDAQRLAAGRTDVRVVVSPPRDVIHALLREHEVLVLLSRRTPRWREQVGLPVVEALAHGCTVVTTSETGLATWLTAHGHAVVEPQAGTDDVVAAVTGALAAARPASDVLADLPSDDGRLAADRWLFAGA